MRCSTHQMKNWKTTIGGAFSASGIALISWPQYISPEDFTREERKYVSLIGLIFTMGGVFFTALFSSEI